MAEHYRQQPLAHFVVKAATAATAGGSLLILSGLTLSGTVVALTIATPLLVIFSPVLVPAALTMLLIIAGFLASGGFGVAALSVVSWIYRRYIGRREPAGAEQLHTASGKGREMKDKAVQHRVEIDI